MRLTEQIIIKDTKYMMGLPEADALFETEDRVLGGRKDFRAKCRRVLQSLCIITLIGDREIDEFKNVVKERSFSLGKT